MRAQAEWALCFNGRINGGHHQRFEKKLNIMRNDKSYNYFFCFEFSHIGQLLVFQYLSRQQELASNTNFYCLSNCFSL